MARQPRRPAKGSGRYSAGADAAATPPGPEDSEIRRQNQLQLLRYLLRLFVPPPVTYEFGDEAKAALASALEADRAEWLRLTGERLPDYSLDAVDKWQELAWRYGLPPEVVFYRKFKWDHVWTAMRGQKARERDAIRARVEAERQALAERQAVVAIDDEYAAAARGLKGKMFTVVWLLHDRDAVCAAKAYTRTRIAEVIGVSESDVQNAMKALRKYGADRGWSLVDSGASGSWLTAEGVAVAARLPGPAVDDLLRTYPRLSLGRGGCKAG